MWSYLKEPSWQCKFKRGWNAEKYTSIAHDKPFSEGACRYAYHALYTKYHATQPHGKKAIVKKMKDFTCWRRENWDQELKLAEKAKYLVDTWNKTREKNQQYTIYVPEVKLIKSATRAGNFSLGEWVTIEPYIKGNYVKWNSNSGWFGDESLSVHAFCHWTYHQSRGNLLLCDAQGVRNVDSYTITDPAICSVVRGFYGMTDLGEPAKAQWFRHHRCNKFCDPSWIRHGTGGTAIPVVKSSSYTWQK